MVLLRKLVYQSTGLESATVVVCSCKGQLVANLNQIDSIVSHTVYTDVHLEKTCNIQISLEIPILI